MCTVILGFQVLPGAAILLGANRDERLARPAEGFALRQRGAMRFVAPRDLKAGGTWLGINAHGVLAAITNRFGPAPDPARRSRGELVELALESDSASAAAARIGALSVDEYNGFHLLAADAHDALIVWNDLQGMHRERLEPGIHVLTERSLGAAENQRQSRVLARCQALCEAGDFDPEHLKMLLSERADGSIDATSVNLPELGYGTRSSTILRLGATPLLLHTDQAPTPESYEELTPLLVDVLSSTGG